MNGTKYLLDTCFILGLYNQNDDVLDRFGDTLIENCHISVINRIEIFGYAHISSTDERTLWELLSEMVCLPLSYRVEMETIKIRKQYKIKLPDAIILATANIYDLELLTLDKGLMKYL
ncbi:PIN domain-containing protein [Psychrobacter sp. I-STPA10]|uniref:PIN domain-containing protein n=1 Tax=Psychrobacter sp. I-STPA10 TaxID=2585769 RepID=UPI001E512FD6|nr:PIN domain-containing protein [Psychrobacter sp. I-STPA10]